MRNFILSLLGVLVAISSVAQDIAVTDEVPPKPEVRFLSSVLLQLDNRRESYINTTGRMNGLKLGLEFYRRLQLGVGFYGNNDFYIYPVPTAGVGDQNFVRFNYFTVFSEVVFFRNYRWQLSAGAAMGSGTIRWKTYTWTFEDYQYSGQKRISDARVTDLSLHAMYRIFPWLGVGAGYGFRSVSGIDDRLLEQYFSDPYFDFRVKFSLGYLYKDIFKVEEILKEKNYYAYRKKKRWAAFKDLLY